MSNIGAFMQFLPRVYFPGELSEPISCVTVLGRLNCQIHAHFQIFFGSSGLPSESPFPSRAFLQHKGCSFLSCSLFSNPKFGCGPRAAFTLEHKLCQQNKEQGGKLRLVWEHPGHLCSWLGASPSLPARWVLAWSWFWLGHE